MIAVLVNGLVAVPAAFALLTWLLLARGRGAVPTAVAGGLVTLAWSAVAAAAAGGPLGGPGSSVDAVWVAALDLHWRLGLDGISAPLVLMTTLVFAVSLASLLRHAPSDAEGGPARTGSLAVLLLVIEAGVLGSFVALDLVLFFVFFEVALVPMWFVINRWGDAADAAARRRAATRFLVFTVTGSALMLVGFLLVRAEAGTFDIVRIAASYTPSGPVALAAAALVALGLAVKTPVWPLHLWLPDAHSKAPTVGSVVLAAVLLKLGTYGLVRFWLPITDAGWLLAPTVAALGAVGIVYAALACLAQTDLKRLIAYSSVGHMGFVVLAAATLTVGGVQAAVFASVAHGLITGLLFLLAGAVKERFHTTDLARLGGLYSTQPRMGGVFAFAAMASLGLPGLAGFWGEVLTVRAALEPAAGLPGLTYRWLAVLAALGIVLTSAYFLALVRSLLQAGATRGEVVTLPTDRVEAVRLPHGPPDATRAEWLVWVPLAVPTLVLGVAPGLLLTPVATAATAFLGSLP